MNQYRFRISAQLSGLFLPVLLSPLSVWGTSSLLTEDDVLGDIPLVSAASRLEQPISMAPASVTLITRELIEASGAQNWVDVFRLVPGFQAYAVNNNHYGISYHGVGREFPNQLEVMVDGRSVYEPLFSTVYWGTLGVNIEDIDYIEVVRGSNAPAYGSNAFMGAVNIVTRKPVQDSGLAVSVTGGDRQTRNSTLRYNNRIGDLDYSINLGSRKNNGFPGTAEGAMEDGQELYQLRFQSSYTPNVLDVIDVAVGYARERIGWGDPDHPDEFIPTHFNGHFQSLGWDHTLLSGGEIRLRAYHNFFRGSNAQNIGQVYQLLGIDQATAEFVSSFDPIPPAVVSQFAMAFGVPESVASPILNELNSSVIEGFLRIESERYDLELEHEFSPGRNLRLVWGVGGRSEYIRGQALLNRDDGVREEAFRWFGHSEWLLRPELAFNAGVMVEHNFIGTLVSPRVALNYEFMPGHTLRGSIAWGNRSPSLLEAYEDNTGRVGELQYEAIRMASDSIGEERLTSYEMGYLASWLDLGLTLDINVYYTKVRDGLETYLKDTSGPLSFFDDSVKITDNVLTADSTGMEMQLHYRPAPGTLIRLHYGYSDVDSVFFSRFEPYTALLSLDDRAPAHAGGVLWDQQWSARWRSGLFVYYQEDSNWRDSEALDGFTRVDANISCAFRVGGQPGKLSLIAQNIGSDYREFDKNNLFEPRVFLKLEMELP